MIVCHCAEVTDREIHRIIDEGATTVGDIIRRCGAGRNCAPCRGELQEMLSAACAGCPIGAAA